MLRCGNASTADPGHTELVTGEPVPLILTFLAPADRCNQRCPACYIDRQGEPVSDFTLAPEHFACIVEELLDDGVPLFGVNFQGYEVTLPKSWPYLVAALTVAREHHVRRSFITNGMLLDKHVESIQALDPQRIAVSLDGADAAVNDRLRGIQGAILATTRSVGRFLREVPHFAPRLSVASALFDEANFRSLLRMPGLLNQMGVRRWALAVEADFVEGQQTHVASRATLVEWLAELENAANEANVRFHFNDEFGLLAPTGGDQPPVPGTKSLFDPEFIVRVDPAGYLRVGRELLTQWTPDERRRWRPGRRRAAEIIGYWDAVAARRARDVSGLAG